jgi:anhydro-N-acetylmuramic acid kinase
MGDLYIGLISGTSMDGIDAALVRFEDASLKLIQTHAHDYPAALRRDLSVAKLDPNMRAIADLGSLHEQVGNCFRDAANVLLSKAGVGASTVAAIGSHGQTIRHEPNAAQPFSLQIGDANIIASGTGITTIADFRRADIELGGQGAPLTPLFHEWLFREPGTNRVVLNIGGIANVTVLYGDASDTIGFDTGPGNTLLDAWIAVHQHEPFDSNGSWAAMGTVNSKLLSRLRGDTYFSMAPPKSTGFEYFNLAWLKSMGADQSDPTNVQATLCQLTAESIAAAIREHAAGTTEVFVCGGGVHNAELMRKLRAALPGIAVDSTHLAGLDPDWVEAVAFAWLAMRTTRGLTGNLPSVTGARQATVLGTTFRAD